jgi:hypothetical protein
MRKMDEIHLLFFVLKRKLKGKLLETNINTKDMKVSKKTPSPFGEKSNC